jgi:hypothetical protein
MKKLYTNLSLYYQIATFVLLLIILFILLLIIFKPHMDKNKSNNIGTIRAVCEAIDPVSDPAYNMREIAKQSILLEEHLTIREKYCSDCIKKHFLHCIGLSEEASMLTRNPDKYLYMTEATPFYKENFNLWLKDCKSWCEESDEVRLKIAGDLRDFRKKLLSEYAK